MSADSRGPWIKTFTGKRFHLLDPRPDEVDIESIAHALAVKCRYAGQCKGFYSVAEHCIIGSNLIEDPFKLSFLLHELSEVFLPDVTSPLKPFVKAHLAWDDPYKRPDSWAVLEALHTNAMLQALGLPTTSATVTTRAVKDMDRRLFNYEAFHIIEGPFPEDYWLVAQGEPIPLQWPPHCWSWDTAEKRFLERYKELRQ